MSIDVKQIVEEVKTSTEQPVDGYTKAIDDMLHSDVSSVSTFIIVLLVIAFFRPIVALATYGIAAFLIFYIVKNYV